MLSEKQKKVFEFAKSDEGGICICVGAIRSGKTWASTLAFGLHAMRLKKPQAHLILGKKLRVIESEIVPHLREVARIVQQPFQHLIIKSKVLIGDSVFHLIAGNDKKSSDRVQGLTAHSALIDEATLLKENFFEVGISRLSFADSKIFVTCNPSHPLHFIKTKWIDQGKYTHHLEFSFEDNPVLAEETKQRYRDMFDGVFARRMVDGLWSAGDGLVFGEYATMERPPVERLRVDIGVDYGTASTTAFVVLETLKDGRFFVPEVVTLKGGYNIKNRTDVELADELFDLAEKYMPRSVVLDPSASSFRMELLKSHRRRFGLRRANNDILPGVRKTGSALAHGKVLISMDCEDLIKELQSYSWDPYRADTVLKENDHCCDALRYVVNDRLDFDHTHNATLPEGF